MKTEHEILREKNARYQIWAQQYTQKDGWVVIPPGVVCPCTMTNDERSRLEVLEFKACPPDRYFLYIDEKTRRATTWTGDTLGTVTFGREFRDNFGGRPVPVRVQAVNGVSYAGTYFKSAGDFARVKRCKA